MSSRYVPLRYLITLQPGDLVRSKLRRDTPYMVLANYGDHITAVSTADITNPSEWEILTEGED
jgi:hypothetical protein